MSAPDAIDCPRCDLTVPVGLPRDAEVVAVLGDDADPGNRPFDPEDDPPTQRVASLRCDAGHSFGVYFRVSGDTTDTDEVTLSDP